MKILFINQYIGIGSTGKIVTDIASHLSEGDEVKNIHGYFKGGEKGFHLFPGDGYQTVSKNQYYSYNIRAKLFGRAGFYAKRQTEKAIAKLGDWVPDVIHMHNIHGYFMHLPTLFEYFEKINKPIIWTLHDCWPLTGHCTHFITSKCDKWKTKCVAPCPERSQYPQGIISCPVEKNFEQKKALYAKVKDNLTIVTPSKWLEDIAKEAAIVDCPTMVINNGIDLDSFQETEKKFRREHHLEDKIVIMGIAAPWGQRKGLDEFLKLSKDLPEKYQIVMVGVREDLAKALPSNIIALPPTSSKEYLADVYSSSDLLVMPTYADNYPTVGLESQACGTPVLAYDAGGTKETLLLEHSSCVKKGDYDALLKEVLSFVPHRIPKEDVQRFSYERMVDEYCALYKKLSSK